MGWPARMARFFPWLLFALALLGQLLLVAGMVRQGRRPIDFLAYHVAADALVRGDSPYLTPAESRRIWQYFHRNEAEVLAADARGAGLAVLREQDARPQQPGPYVYPPTLALLVAQLRISALAWAAILLLAILAFARLWLGSTGASPWWLLLIVGSWDVLASVAAGNVELLLLFAALAAARLLWARHAVAAAPLIALVALIKPFYALFFVAFGLLQVLPAAGSWRARLRVPAVAGGFALALGALEVARWGAALRAEAAGYLRHALDYQWFVLPPAEQTPMSAWNRTPLQALVSAGLPAPTAAWASLLLWLGLLGLTLGRTRRASLTFPAAFAMALVLLYWGRPVGWGLLYLEVVVAVAAWPRLGRRGRGLLLAAALALMASHWWALALTARGHGMPLVTLQRADRPWETWSVLPLSWLLLAQTLPSRPAGALVPLERPPGPSTTAGPPHGQ